MLIRLDLMYPIGYKTFVCLRFKKQTVIGNGLIFSKISVPKPELMSVSGASPWETLEMSVRLVRGLTSAGSRPDA
jgi:hypothetical protein